MAGAYSDLACRDAFPAWATLPCATFEAVFAAAREGRAARAMIPIENSVAGRVADIHHLLPDSGLHIVAEHFQRVNHHWRPGGRRSPASRPCTATSRRCRSAAP
jgi:prephenate dehydratase